MKKIINSRLKNLVLSQKKKNPGLGVRKISLLLNQKYRLQVSKSTIYNIIKAEGVSLAKGAKKAKAAYQKEYFSECGLLLLRCIDDWVGLFGYLSRELKAYFPKIDRQLLEKFLMLSSFAAFSCGRISEKIRDKGYLRLAGLSRFPAKKFAYFQKQVNSYKPAASLASLKSNLILVSGLKLIFQGGETLFLDSKMATLWDEPPHCDYFFSTLKNCYSRLNQVFAANVFFIGYTKSFDYLSPLVFRLIRGFKQGLARIEILDSEGKLIEKIKVSKKFDFILGYYPRGVTRGMRLEGRLENYRKLYYPCLGGFYWNNLLFNFLQTDLDKGVRMKSILIKRKKKGFPEWGLVNSFGRIELERAKKIILNYLRLWPWQQKSMEKGIKEIEKTYSLDKGKNTGVSCILPQKLVFPHLEGFGLISQLLAVIFKEFIPGIEPKRKKGAFQVKKAEISLILKGLTPKSKEKLNQQSFFLEGKRVFFV